MMKTKKNGNIEVTWSMDFDKRVLENFSNAEWAKLSNYVVEQVILPKIDRGVSPVNGERMFQKYKNPEKYPGDKKQSNKPNLTLTGEMLSHYVAFSGSAPMEIYIGMPPETPELEKTKARANNEGTQSLVATTIANKTQNRNLRKKIKAASKGIPSRPFIPRKGQMFTKDIVLAIRKYFAYCLDQAIKKGENK